MNRERLRQVGLEHLLEGIESVEPFKQKLFFDQLDKYGLTLYQKQRDYLEKKKSQPFGTPITPITAKRGSGRMAALLLAGGMGSRLGFSAPKGCLPITNILKKSLFRYFFEKIAAASHQLKERIQVALVTSPHNHQETMLYLEENHFFGVNPIDIDYCIQSELPLLNREKKWFLESPGKLATAPDGNGTALLELQYCGIADKWRKKGIEYVNVLPIDNPLANPIDFEMAGSELTVRAIRRRDGEEKLGILQEHLGKLQVIEYSEFPQDEWEKGEKWQWGYSGLCAFHLDFLKREHPPLPWHIAEKNAFGQDIYKFETFLFDLFPNAQTVSVLASDRKNCFAPIKKREDLEEVSKILYAFDQKIFSEVTGLEPPKELFELDPAFYFPTDELIRNWNGYILK